MPRLSKIGAAALAAFGWTGISSVTVSYLVVAGGGAGGFNGNGGGGGAGGFLTGTSTLNPTLSYSVTVGAGGTSVASISSTNGSNSTFNSITSVGGGAGGPTASLVGAGNSGGSGGGGLNDSTNYAGGAGTAGQGNAGGASGGGGSPFPGGGGGGASAAGTVGTSGGQGGAGTASSITGSSVTYAGGGGGARSSGGVSAGGAGGGGNGGVASLGIAGTANTGGGGGGTGAAGIGGQGGSGVVIISYVGAQQFGGGNVTSDGTNTIHTFTTSGTLSVLVPLTASALVVAGGASGGSLGGGGAGGFRTATGLTIDSSSNYLVTVGAGAAASTVQLGNYGNNSVFSSITATGGGRGEGDSGTPQAGVGGSGGGGGANMSGSGGGGGGGGAGAVGSNGGGANGYSGGAGNTPSTSPSQGNNGGTGGSSTSTAGNGGAGSASSISGSSVTYAGGGGAYTNGGTGTAGTGGSGGGGNGGRNGLNATAGTANTGSGGGGNGYTSAGGFQGSSGAGGSGVVIISYPGATQQMAGGTVTISGGNVIHTFTSSGYLTPIELVGRSLRFRSSATAYLNRTPSVASNRRTWTWSGWVKRGTLGAINNGIFTAGTSFAVNNNNLQTITFASGDVLTLTSEVGGTAQYNLVTTQVFRDPSAWYHIVVALDTTEATSSNRVKLYINGTQVTAFSTASYPAQNYEGWINLTNEHRIGSRVSNDFDGYMTEINFVDGQALTPSSFGTFNSYGVWQPITYGGSYGTNGFYLTFGDNTSTTTLGYDTSPQGNNWTTNNISVTAGVTYDSMLDVPTLTSATVANYCTLNPLDISSSVTLSNGNLAALAASGGVSLNIRSTYWISTGKWYWETTITTMNGAMMTGIANASVSQSGSGLNQTGAFIYYGTSGANGLYKGSTNTSAAATFTNGDVIGIAFDADNLTIQFFKNNTSQGTLTALTAGTYSPAVSCVPTTGAWTANFGQQPFTYTAPSGFVALNTYNLSTPTIPNGAVYMAATTYTGTGASLTVANTVNGTAMQPDWVWVKGRSGATDHAWYDVVRGTTKQLESNTTTVETTEATGLTAFGSTGFTVGALAQMNTSAATYVAWQWAANGAGVSNTSGTITSTVSANTTAGFAVVTYTGTGANATVGHGLGVTPSMMIFKNRTGVYNWAVYHASLANASTTLDFTTAAADGTNATTFNATAPTSSVFSLGTNDRVNRSTDTFVAYVFAAIAGYSAFGSYTGNGSTDGPFVYTGFRPRFVMVKASSNATSSTVWTIWDTSRSPYNASVNELFPNSSAAEGVDSSGIDILSNGFKPKRNSEYANFSGWTYIYMAFAENPFKYSSAR